jgi:hypothetical protein
MSRERLVVDFKLARFTRLLARPAEMTKGGKGETAVVETAKVMDEAAAPQVAATTVTMAATTTKGKNVEDRSRAMQASRNLMKNFLKAIATPPVKRGRDNWAASPRPDQVAKEALQGGRR